MAGYVKISLCNRNLRFKLTSNARFDVFHTLHCLVSSDLVPTVPFLLININRTTCVR
jgi:hypothetical protein